MQQFPRTDRLEAPSSFQSTGPTSLQPRRASTYSSIPSPILIRASRHPSMSLFVWSASPPPYTASQSLVSGRFCSKPTIGRWPSAKLAGASNLLSRRRIVIGQDLQQLCSAAPGRARASSPIETRARHRQQRFAHLADGRLAGALFLAPEPVVVSRDWAIEQLGADLVGIQRARVAVVAGRPARGLAERGATVCSCFRIGAIRSPPPPRRAA